MIPRTVTELFVVSTAAILIDNERMVRRAWVLLVALASIAEAQVAQPPPPPPAPSPPPPPPTDTTAAPTEAAPQPPPPLPPTIQPYPGQQPPGMQPLPPPPRTVMSKRWAIGVDFGPESYEPDVDGSQKTEFGQFELAARYRIRKPIELGLALHLGGSKDIGEGGLYFDFRYRFMAERPLNVYALASLGVLAVAHENATEDAKRGRGSIRLGAGVEYRWNWFALVLELRLIHVGENKELADPIDTAPVDYQLSRYKLSGGSLALGANFYF
jgi:hypothetical protein